MTATILFLLYLALRAIWITVLKARWDNAVNNYARKVRMSDYLVYGLKNIHFNNMLIILLVPVGWKLSDFIPEEVYKQIIPHEKW